MEFENGERCESIANAILSCLAENNIDVAFARGQTLPAQAYDGASAMSSEACVVQGRIRKIAPMALYTHRNSHVLNVSVQGRIQEFLIRGVQTLVQKGLLRYSFEANYFSPTPSLTSRGRTL